MLLDFHAATVRDTMTCQERTMGQSPNSELLYEMKDRRKDDDGVNEKDINCRAHFKAQNGDYLVHIVWRHEKPFRHKEKAQ